MNSIPIPGSPVSACLIVFHLTSPSSSMLSDGTSTSSGGVKRRLSVVPSGSGLSVRMKIPIDEMSVMYA